MVLGKLTPLEQMRLGGVYPDPHMRTTGTLALSLLRDSYHKHDCLINNHAECLSAQLCLGGEKLTHYCQELGSDSCNCP